MSKKLQSLLFSLFYPANEYMAHKSYANRIIGFITLGLLSRLLPHPPNFTAMNAIALFGICTLGNLRSTVFSVFLPMLLCDLIFGLHASIGFVYFSFGLIIFIGYWLMPKRSMRRAFFLLSLSSVIFFIITNFGIWLSGSMYPNTLIGLGLCYFDAIPFFANNLLGTLFYGSLIYGIKEGNAIHFKKGPIKI